MLKFCQKYGSCLFFGGLLAGYLLATLFLFHRQSVNYGGNYFSDMSSYIGEIRGVFEDCEFPYPVMFWVARCFSVWMGPYHAMAFTVTVLNGLTALALKYFLNRSIGVKRGERADYAVSLLVFALLLVSMLFPFSYLGRYRTEAEGFLYRYTGTFTPNPYHNATYLAARPFAVVTFFLGADLLGDYEKTDAWIRKKTAVFALMLALSTLTKPSFTLVFVSVCGLVMLWRLLRSAGRGWKAFWQLGIAFLPTFATLLYQYGSMFVGEAKGQETGITVAFLKAWHDKTDHVPLAIFLAAAFPLSVLLFQRGRVLENGLLKLAWQCYLLSLLMLLFLREKGYRAEHLNFAWGYMYGLFFLFVTSAVALTEETRRRGQPVWQLSMQWLFFAAHLVCGVDYFKVLLQGGYYY